ncbi:MAG: M48 family metallopeptidase [Granulosicoccaceae bacterium]|jgi:predicted Zn-dependent protease
MKSRFVLTGILLAMCISPVAAFDFGGLDVPFGGGNNDGGGIDIGETISGVKDVSRSITGIDEEEEIAIGNDAAAMLLGAAPLVTDPALQTYINRVGRWVVSQTERPDLPWRFAVLDTDSVNAFATPGGKIFITRGLLYNLRNEAELAGVLAHEAAHVVRKHHIAAMTSLTSGAGGLLKLYRQTDDGQGNAAATTLVDTLKNLYTSGLDQEDEFEADRMGVVIAARSGYDPYALVAVLQTLETARPEERERELMYRTHPAPRERIERLDSALEPLQSYAEQPAVQSRFADVMQGHLTD